MVRNFQNHRHSIAGEKKPSPLHRHEKLTIAPVYIGIYSNNFVIEYIRIRFLFLIQIYSYSVFIFESNVFVFVFYFLNEYIPIRIRWSKYYLLTSVSLQHVSTLCTLHNAQVCGLVWWGVGVLGLQTQITGTIFKIWL